MIALTEDVHHAEIGRRHQPDLGRLRHLQATFISSSVRMLPRGVSGGF